MSTPERGDLGAPVYDPASTGAAARVDASHTLQRDVVGREKERFGGFHFGAAFFGWLTAVGAVVVLGTLVGAIGLAVASEATLEEVVDAAASDTAGIVGAIVLAVVLFVAYVAGGYVAGRMARFSGVKQGLAVWIWAVVIAIVIAVVGAITGSRDHALSGLQGLPQIPVDAESATLTGILTALGVAIVTLLGALLGGAAGMRYHRRVDRVGLGRQENGT